MLHPFVSSQPTRRNRLGELWLSLVVHGGLIAAAVAATAHPRTRITYVRDGAMERVVFAEPAPLASRHGRPSRRATRRARPRQLRFRVPDLSAVAEALGTSAGLSAAIADVTRGLDAADMTGVTAAAAPVAFGPGTADAVRTLVARAYAVATGGGAYSAEVVEKTVWPERGNPAPRYPGPMLEAHIEASFLVRFVVDSTGRVDTRSIVFPDTAHRLFVASVRDALRRSRYLPAELGGRRVRQLVEQVFSFRVAP